jgi:hypothetical protein
MRIAIKVTQRGRNDVEGRINQLETHTRPFAPEVIHIPTLPNDASVPLNDGRDVMLYSTSTVKLISQAHQSSRPPTMASRSKLCFTLALCFNCFILTFLILDSRSFQTLDINLGLLPELWEEPWLRTGKAESRGEQLYLQELSVEPKQKCAMCSANSTLCEELG